VWRGLHGYYTQCIVQDFVSFGLVSINELPTRFVWLFDCCDYEYSSDARSKTSPIAGMSTLLLGNSKSRKKSVAMPIDVKHRLSRRTLVFTHQPLPKQFMNAKALDARKADTIKNMVPRHF
jgi:hypothetical protein